MAVTGCVGGEWLCIIRLLQHVHNRRQCQGLPFAFFVYLEACS